MKLEPRVCASIKHKSYFSFRLNFQSPLEGKRVVLLVNTHTDTDMAELTT